MTQCKNIDESTKITKKNVCTFAKLFVYIYIVDERENRMPSLLS